MFGPARGKSAGTTSVGFEGAGEPAAADTVACTHEALADLDLARAELGVHTRRLRGRLGCDRQHGGRRDEPGGASLVLHAAHAALERTVLRIVLLQRRRALEHVEHPLVLIHRGRLFLLLRRRLVLGCAAVGSGLVLVVLFAESGSRSGSCVLSGIARVVVAGVTAFRVARDQRPGAARRVARPAPASGFLSFVPDAAKRDGAVVRGVAADAVARVVRQSRDQPQRKLVSLDRGAVVAPQELEVARQVEGARPKIDRHAGVGGDEPHDAQRALDLIAPLLRALASSSGVDAAPRRTAPPHRSAGRTARAILNRPSPRSKLALWLLSDALRRADVAAFALSGRKVLVEQRHGGARRRPASSAVDRIVDGGRVAHRTARPGRARSRTPAASRAAAPRRQPRRRALARVRGAAAASAAAERRGRARRRRLR